MTVDKDLMARLAASDPAAAIEEHYGAAGMTALRLLARGLEQIGEQLAFEMLGGGLTVIAALGEDVVLLPADRTAQVRPEQLPTLVEGTATIQVVEDGLLSMREEVEFIHLADRAVVYRFDGGDHLVINGSLWPVENPTSFPSRWRVPTFFDLADSLQHYQTAVSPTCRCHHLRSAWHDPPRRWLFMNKPEHVPPVSVEQHLINSLRLGRVEIRREQPIGGRKPPDIKVTWSEQTASPSSKSNGWERRFTRPAHGSPGAPTKQRQTRVLSSSPTTSTRTRSRRPSIKRWASDRLRRPSEGRRLLPTDLDEGAGNVVCDARD